MSQTLKQLLQETNLTVFQNIVPDKGSWVLYVTLKQVERWLEQKRQEYPEKYPAKTDLQQVWVLAVLDFINELLGELKE